MNNDDKKRLKIKNGLKIVELKGGKLLKAGIKKGFIITKIDKKNMYTTDDITSALQNKKGGVLIEGVYPNGVRAYFGFGV